VSRLLAVLTVHGKRMFTRAQCTARADLAALNVEALPMQRSAQHSAVWLFAIGPCGIAVAFARVPYKYEVH
jgi:hypothetical protein